jgi:hypothetical protein
MGMRLFKRGGSALGAVDALDERGALFFTGV